MSTPVFTIGYEGRALNEFIAQLRRHGVARLADVREAPVSRKRGFSKTPLTTALEESGIVYRHWRALGCPKPIRDAHKADADWARYTREFMKHLACQQAAVEELAALAAAIPTALLCYEADFNRCHRTYVARAVARRAGAAVVHLTADGAVREPAAESASADPQVAGPVRRI